MVTKSYFSAVTNGLIGGSEEKIITKNN